MRILACVIALVASVGLGPFAAAGADIPLITHAGRPYVPLDRVAAALRARPDWTSASARARLVLGSPHVEQVHDGQVGELRLETAGGSTTATVTLEGDVADVREITLVDPFRLVLDFARPAEREGRPEAAPLRQIVLDAGHGGHDAGAIGPTGLLEKDLVLDITFRVARLCEQRLGIKASLSRTGDYFVPLADRTSFANRQRADLFVSIHANAQRDLSAAGVETYFLSSEATDIAARQVAAKE